MTAKEAVEEKHKTQVKAAFSKPEVKQHGDAVNVLQNDQIVRGIEVEKNMKKTPPPWLVTSDHEIGENVLSLIYAFTTRSSR